MKRISRFVRPALAITTVVCVSAVMLASCGRQSSSSSASSTVRTPVVGVADWHGTKPTVVLVHGAWADAAGWSPVITELQEDGFVVKAPPNPLRGLTADAAYISSVLKQIKGPVILAGHSYGGAVITDAAAGNSQVKALVYIAAFAPDQGDSLASLNASAKGKEIPAVPAMPSQYPQNGSAPGTELTIDPAQYPSVFLNNELPAAQERALAVEQRPLSLTAATEPSGTPAWKSIPSWYMVASADHAIAPNLERFMAARARAHTVEVNGPHLIMLTAPDAVTSLIEKAAVATNQ